LTGSGCSANTLSTYRLPHEEDGSVETNTAPLEEKNQ